MRKIRGQNGRVGGREAEAIKKLLFFISKVISSSQRPWNV
jgi:hypothetical protein